MVLVQKELQNAYIGEYVIPQRTFTISRTEQSDMSSWWTYSDDAAWLTAGSTAFDEFFWYSWVRLNSSWVETSEITQTQSWWGWKLDITQLGTLTSGDNVMIKFPKRWVKMTKSWSVVTLSITNEENKSWYQYYAFTRWTTIKDNLYIGAYAMSSWNVSLSWKAPQWWVSPVDFYNNIINTYWVSWYSMLWIYQRWYISALYMMKYGNPDSRTVVGKWYVSWTAVKNTWATNSQINATYWTSNTSDQMKLFWLEDWWWNSIMYVAYCMWDSSRHLIVNQTATLTNSSVYSTDNYPIGLWGAGTSGWFSSIIWTNDCMFLPANANGSETTYYRERTRNQTSRAVCAWANYWQAGWVFTLDYTTTGSTYAENWTRLMKL